MHARGWARRWEMEEKVGKLGRARDGEGDDPTGKTNGELGREGGGMVVRRRGEG